MTITFQEENIQQAAAQFVQAMHGATVFAFYGKMGAGKTTFIKALCRELGVADTVNSPTFAIVNEYEDGQGAPAYHSDLYRIKRRSEAYDMGCAEYFYSGHPCFVEWPELIEDILPQEAVRVDISELPDGSRQVIMGD